MTLFQDTVGDPRTAAARLAGVLGLYGAVGDAACGNPAGFAARKAATAVSLASVAGIDGVDRDALYYAGVLHAVGALGNAAYRKGERLSERMARIESWDVPAQGARICLEISALPEQTSDYVRWQAECWDGTGYPDQSALGRHPVARGTSRHWPIRPFALADPGRRSRGDQSRGRTKLRSRVQPHLHDVVPHARRRGRAGRTTARCTYAPTMRRPAPCWMRSRTASTCTTASQAAGNASRGSRMPRRKRSSCRRRKRTALAIAVRIVRSGRNRRRASTPVEASFDPLARLGIDVRAAHGLAAAALLAGNAALGARGARPERPRRMVRWNR